MPRPRILVLGEALQPSGYARVVQSLLPSLSQRYLIDVFAASYSGPPMTGDVSVHPNQLAGDFFGIEQIPALLDKLRPAILWIVFDYEMYVYNRRAIEARAGRFRTVLYSPIDGENPRPGWVRDLEGVDRLVLFTEGAKRTITKALGRRSPPTAVIPHGVDTATFHPLAAFPKDSRTLARTTLFRHRPELRNAFVVLNANRNNERKRPDLTLEGFARFARGKRNVYLYMHMRRDNWCLIAKRARELGISKRLLLSSRQDIEPKVSDERMNLIYNACDVGINTSTGEGWGLVAFEHAATGAAQIMARHSRCEELWDGGLWEGSAILMKPVRAVQHPMALCEFQETNASTVAAALERLYRSAQVRRKYSARAYARALDPRLRWEVIGEQWLKLFDEMLDHRKGEQPNGRIDSNQRSGKRQHD